MNDSMSSGCTACSGTIDGLPIPSLCVEGLTNCLGIVITPPIGTPGATSFTFTAPKGIFLDVNRFNGAISKFNSQLPTGSLQSFVSSIFSMLGTSTATNAEDTLAVTLGIIVLLSFIFGSIIFIVLMASGIMSVGVGITLIFVILIFSILSVIIIISEIINFATTIETQIGNQIDPTINILQCALRSGICCYGGASCCCSGGSSASTCTSGICLAS
jgi:hypothetical protein